jgi:hypothetical protein
MRLALCFTVVAIAPVYASAESSEGFDKAGIELVEAAAKKELLLPSFEMTSTVGSDNNIWVTKRLIENDPAIHEHTEFVEVERNGPEGGDEARAAYACISGQWWKYDGEKCRRLERSPLREHSIPLHLSTTKYFPEGVPILVSLVPNQVRYGKRASKVVVEVSDLVAAKVKEGLVGRDNAEPLNLLVRRSGEAGPHGASIPTRYVYYIEEVTGLICSWEAFNAYGQRIDCIERQEIALRPVGAADWAIRARGMPH